MSSIKASRYIGLEPFKMLTSTASCLALVRWRIAARLVGQRVVA